MLSDPLNRSTDKLGCTLCRVFGTLVEASALCRMRSNPLAQVSERPEVEGLVAASCRRASAVRTTTPTVLAIHLYSSSYNDSASASGNCFMYATSQPCVKRRAPN